MDAGKASKKACPKIFVQLIVSIGFYLVQIDFHQWGLILCTALSVFSDHPSCRPLRAVAKARRRFIEF